MNPEERSIQVNALPVLIVGSGALATLFANRLSRAGNPVTLLGSWAPALEALNQQGARVREADGRWTTAAVRAVSQTEEAGGFQYALVLVKAWQTSRAAQQLAECLIPEGVALGLQNGLGNREILAAAIGSPRVALGATTTGAALLEPGAVQYGGSGAVQVQRHARLAPLLVKLRQAGFEVRESADLQGLLWGKLVINAAINPLTALHAVPNGALLEDPQLRKILRRTAEETAQVAGALGIRLPFDNPAEAAEAVARRTAANRSSMLQDLQRGAPTEIEAISGEIVRQAEALGLKVPHNQALLEQMHARLLNLGIASVHTVPAETAYLPVTGQEFE